MSTINERKIIDEIIEIIVENNNITIEGICLFLLNKGFELKEIISFFEQIGKDDYILSENEDRRKKRKIKAREFIESKDYKVEFSRFINNYFKQSGLKRVKKDDKNIIESNLNERSNIIFYDFKRKKEII